MTSPAGVAITGIGIVSPFGCGKESLVAAWRENRRVPAVPVAELQHSPLENQLVGLVPELDKASELLDRKLIKFMSTATMLGCLAGKEAATEAQILKRFAPERIGIYAATGLTAARVDSASQMLENCLDATGNFSARLFGQVGLKQMNPLESFKVLPNMPPCILSVMLGIKGPNLIFNPWEGQAAFALQEAIGAVARGEVACALAGGADTPTFPSTLAYLRQMGLIAPHEFPSCAGCYLVLERADQARQAGVKVYATIGHLAIHNTGEPAHDPLANVLGRTYAAAPALLTAALALGLTQARRLVCTRGMAVEIGL